MFKSKAPEKDKDVAANEFSILRGPRSFLRKSIGIDPSFRGNKCCFKGGSQKILLTGWRQQALHYVAMLPRSFA
jgi:hypothetical protein